MARTARQNLRAIINAAVEDLKRNGYDNQKRIDYWVEQIRDAVSRVFVSPTQVDAMLRRGLGAVYRKLVEKGSLEKKRGVPRFTVEKLRPHLRAELDRRIMASANLIKLHRERTIAETLQRFQGWATSVPAGGSSAFKTSAVREQIEKPSKEERYRIRRVEIDQGHKLTASINEVVSRDGGAIALIWHSHWRQAGYDYREDHKERDQKVYLLKKSWARDNGLVKPGKPGYYEDITAVAEEPFCRCYAEWLYHLNQLPADMLTDKGKRALDAVKIALATPRADADNRRTKEEVAYVRDHGPSPERCDRCSHYVAATICDAVIGEIEPGGWCELFHTARADDEAPTYPPGIAEQETASYGGVTNPEVYG